MQRYDELLGELAQAVAAGETAREAVAPERFLAEGVGDTLSPTPISADAVALLVTAEVSSSANYAAKLTHPVWPGGNSGVTIGIGYDVGTVGQAALAADWLAELGQATIGRLAPCCGVLGAAAQALLAQVGAVTIPFDQADRVFLRRSVPIFVARTERALANTALLAPDCLGALVSLTYNRGAAFNRPEDRFAEMRALRDHMAAKQFAAIPADLRGMKRIWANDPALRGVVLRREAEAQLFERGLAAMAGHQGGAPASKT